MSETIESPILSSKFVKFENRFEINKLNMATITSKIQKTKNSVKSKNFLPAVKFIFNPKVKKSFLSGSNIGWQILL